MDSVLQRQKKCLLCGKTVNLDKHHVFYGAGLRDKSEEYGLTVWLCHENCHLQGVHAHSETDLAVKIFAQKKAMKKYGWTTKEFITLFRKNFI